MSLFGPVESRTWSERLGLLILWNLLGLGGHWFTLTLAGSLREDGMAGGWNFPLWVWFGTACWTDILDALYWASSNDLATDFLLCSIVCVISAALLVENTRLLSPTSALLLWLIGLICYHLQGMGITLNWMVLKWYKYAQNKYIDAYHNLIANLLVWIISIPVLDPLIMIAVHCTLLMLDKLQWKGVGWAPFAVKSSKLLSDTLRMYEPLRFNLSAWPHGSTSTWNSSVCEQRKKVKGEAIL